MSNKLKVGIDINEILRAKWLQFDRFYVEEFGEEGVPEKQPYVYDYFNTYKWKDTYESEKELKEPEDMPNDINPLDYQVDENGEALADFALFKPVQRNLIPAKQVYNRFMYEDYLFELHASAPIMYKNMDLHVNNFYLKYGDTVDFVVLSKENRFSIPPTLFFLSKMTSRFKNYSFVNESKEMWNDVDILITTDPEILEKSVPRGKKLIKINRPYNEKIKAGSLEVLQLVELIDNSSFEKIIKYKKQ